MKAGNHIIISLALLTGAAFIQGCVARNDSAVAEIDPSGWSRHDVRQAVYSNSDTASLRSIDIMVVYNNLFLQDRSPLTVSVTTISPDSVSVTENIAIIPERRPQAPSSGYIQAIVPYRKNVSLSQEGDYIFSFAHSEEIPAEGIKAMGVIISDENTL